MNGQHGDAPVTAGRASSQHGDAPATAGRAGGGWLECLPELSAAAFLVLSTSVAVYAYAGFGTAVLAVGGWAVVALATIPMLTPAARQRLAQPEQWLAHTRTSFLGFWRKRSMLQDATASMAAYDADVRPALQHLLAARLAERHAVSLHADPAAARRLLLPGRGDQALWFWLDPGRPAESDPGRPGIPPRTLSAIIDRLERL